MHSCGECKGPAVSFCQDCKSFFCGICRQKHVLADTFRGHQVCVLEKSAPLSELPAENTEMQPDDPILFPGQMKIRCKDNANVHMQKQNEKNNEFSNGLSAVATASCREKENATNPENVGRLSRMIVPKEILQQINHDTDAYARSEPEKSDQATVNAMKERNFCKQETATSGTSAVNQTPNSKLIAQELKSIKRSRLFLVPAPCPFLESLLSSRIDKSASLFLPLQIRMRASRLQGAWGARASSKDSS